MKIRNAILMSSMLLFTTANSWADFSMQDTKSQISIILENKSPLPMNFLLTKNDSLAFREGPNLEKGQSIKLASGKQQKFVLEVDGLTTSWEVVFNACQEGQISSTSHTPTCTDSKQRYICNFSAKGIGNVGHFSAEEKGSFKCQNSKKLGDSVVFTVG